LSKDLPIGIFDSGVGGLTVYKALRSHLPDERFVYLGDTARVPYGTRSLKTIEMYSIENARFLQKVGIKMLVVACNTASALALPLLQKSMDMPVIGVIEPGAQAAYKASKSGRIGVIATEATVNSRAYSRAIEQLDKEANVSEQACPLFVPLAEEGWAETEVAQLVAREYLKSFVTESVDVLVLGCTHYPILKNVIQQTIGGNVKLIDSGEATALTVESILSAKDLRRETAVLSEDQKRHLCDDLDHFYVTDAAKRFAGVAERFLGCAPSVLQAVELRGQDELRTK
jgi:glutamate racemase